MFSRFVLVWRAKFHHSQRHNQLGLRLRGRETVVGWFVINCFRCDWNASQWYAPLDTPTDTPVGRPTEPMVIIDWAGHRVVIRPWSESNLIPTWPFSASATDRAEEHAGLVSVDDASAVAEVVCCPTELVTIVGEISKCGRTWATTRLSCHGGRYDP